MTQIETELNEIPLAHAKELAHETLQLLLPFAEKLSDLSQKESLPNEENLNQLQKLLDGLQIFTDSILQVKTLFQISSLSPVDELEEELMIILKDLLNAQESSNAIKRSLILGKSLPENLKKWGTSGIPTLIRARDS